jgi:adenylate cyclase
VGVVAATVTLILVLFGQLEWLEYRSLDWLFELRSGLFQLAGIQPPTAPIVIVEIDEASIREIGAWPFRRAMHAELLDRISEWKPLVIGVDVIFPQPSRYGAEDDHRFKSAIARARNVVLAAACTTTVQPLGDIGLKLPITDCDLPLPTLRESAVGWGPVNVIQDNLDTQVRRAPLRMSVGDQPELGFDAQIHRVATLAGLSTSPLPEREDILINFRGGAGTFPSIPYYRIVNGEVTAKEFPEELRDKIVLIGSTTRAEHDIFPTVFARGDGMAGVEIHANILQTLIRGDRIREVPRLVSSMLAVVAALAGSVLVVRLRAVRALAIVVIAMLVGAMLLFAGFAAANVWMRGMVLTVGLALGYGATVLENFVREQREKQRLSRFFSPDVLREVVRDRDGHLLRPRRRFVTVLFSDIRGFTTISERLQPEQVDEMLREYLTVMTEVVFRHRGTIDKYMGDGIMALYNAPREDSEHALNAIRTALEFQERVIPFSARWEAKLGVPIRCGVGINSGEAIVGSLGSRQRNEYTAIGDPVNLAARLESVTKDYRVPDHHQRVHVRAREGPVPDPRARHGDGEGQVPGGEDLRRHALQHAPASTRAARRGRAAHRRRRRARVSRAHVRHQRGRARARRRAGRLDRRQQGRGPARWRRSGAPDRRGGYDCFTPRRQGRPAVQRAGRGLGGRGRRIRRARPRAGRDRRGAAGREPPVAL